MAKWLILKCFFKKKVGSLFVTHAMSIIFIKMQNWPKAQLLTLWHRCLRTLSIMWLEINREFFHKNFHFKIMIWNSCIQPAFFIWLHPCFKAFDLNRSEGTAKIYFRYLLLFVTKKVDARKDKIRRQWNLTEKEPSEGQIFRL